MDIGGEEALDLGGGSKSSNARRRKRRLAKRVQMQTKSKEALAVASEALAAEEQKRVTEALNYGVVFKSNGNNCDRQRGVIAKGVLLKGSGLRGNAVRSWKKVKSAEGRMAARNAEMEKVVLEQKCTVDTKTTALYYHASENHKPTIVDVDGDLERKLANGRLKRMRKRRAVKVGVVETLVERGEMELIGDQVAVEAKDCFMKMPMEDSERRIEGLYEAFLELEKTCWKMKNNCRTDTEGERIACMDGEMSCYMNFGATTNKFGKGMKMTKHGLMENESFCRWINKVERKGEKHLPRSVLGVLRAMKENSGVTGCGKWGAVAAGRNVFLNAHVDVDATWSITSVITEDDSNDIVCYFVFPTLKVAIPMRNGDILAFNARLLHCVSSRRSATREGFCMSLYSNAGLAGANDRNTEIGEDLAEAGLKLKSIVSKIEKCKGE